jgi:hypothetical protein
MSYISDELERQMTAAKTNPSQVAERTQISASQIYKWVNGDQTSIGPDQLTALSKTLSRDPHDHAALLKAHLMDEKFGPGAHLVRVEIDTPSHLRDKPRPQSKGEQALEYLSHARMQNEDANKLLIIIARNMGAEI